MFRPVDPVLKLTEKTCKQLEGMLPNFLSDQLRNIVRNSLPAFRIADNDTEGFKLLTQFLFADSEIDLKKKLDLASFKENLKLPLKADENDIKLLYKFYNIFFENFLHFNHFSYPHGNGEVMTQTIGEWQNAMMEKHAGHEASLGSLHNRVSMEIDGHEHEISVMDQDSDVMDEIELFCKQLKIDEEQQVNLESWISEHGPSRMINFISDFFNRGHFGQNISLPENWEDAVQATWKIKNNQIVFEFQLNVNLIKFDDQPYARPIEIMESAASKILKECDVALIKDRKLFPPIISFNVEISVAHEGNNIKPKITKCDVTCHADRLKNGDVILRSPVLNPDLMHELQARSSQASKLRQ